MVELWGVYIDERLKGTMFLRKQVAMGCVTFLNQRLQGRKQGAMVTTCTNFITRHEDSR